MKYVLILIWNITVNPFFQFTYFILLFTTVILGVVKTGGLWTWSLMGGPWTRSMKVGPLTRGSMFCTFLYATAICLIFRKMQICNLRNGALLIFWLELIMYNINNATSCIYEVLSNQNRWVTYRYSLGRARFAKYRF